MIRISEAFRNKKALITYLMAGDPDLSVSAEYILTLQEAGADMIEIGIPFSDPIAEGEVIQAAALRALTSGTTLEGVFEMTSSLKDKMKIPMVFMTYLNPVFVYGYERFFSRCTECGICGVIIPDMPFEEQDEAKDAAKKYGTEIVTLAAPTSEKRIREIAASAEGFVYLVSSMGVTGMRSEITADVSSIAAEIRRYSDIPAAVGFGISVPEQAAQYAAAADGVIVGSAIVDIIARHGENTRQSLYEYVRSMKSAL